MAAINEYPVDVGNTPTISPGDLIDMEADGNVSRAAADAGTSVIGVCAYVLDTNRAPIALGQLATTTVGYVGVYDDPSIIFRVQEDGDTTPISDRTCVGATANHIDAAGSTTTGKSVQTLDSTDVGTGAQLKIIGLYDVPGNAWADTYTELLVVINEHHYRGAVAGV